MNKIICFIMSFAIIISSFLISNEKSLVYAANDNYAETTAQLLSDLGVLPETNSQEANLTRGTYTAYMARLYGGDGAISNSAVFNDVTPEYKYFGEINFAYEVGLVNGYENMMFSPNDNILSIDAITILVRLLGYGYIQKQQGTETVALQIGLLKNVAVSMNEYLTVSNYVCLMKNAINIDIFGKSVNGEYSVIEGKNILSKYLMPTE